jgi:hypothetical protein
LRDIAGQERMITNSCYYRRTAVVGVITNNQNSLMEVEFVVGDNANNGKKDKIFPRSDAQCPPSKGVGG